MGVKPVIAIACVLACLVSAAIGLTVGLLYRQPEITALRQQIDDAEIKRGSAAIEAAQWRQLVTRDDDLLNELLTQVKELSAEAEKERKRADAYSDALHELRSSLPSTYKMD